MKNIRINEKLKTRIISGGLSLVLVASGFGLGKLDSKDNNSSKNNSTKFMIDNELVDKYLTDYITKREELEKDINSLVKQKEELKKEETFDVKNLIVIENSNINNKTNLYILCTTTYDGICYEYHNDFEAWYRMHPKSEHLSICSEYIHFDECEPLFNYLTDEEIKKITSNGGKIITSDLDKILVRIRADYQKQKSKSLNLLNN